MDNGGSEVLSYKVRYEDQAGNLTSVDVDAQAVWTPQALLVSGLSEGELYTFYVQAVNAYGTSGASPALTVVTALPAGMVCRIILRRKKYAYLPYPTPSLIMFPAIPVVPSGKEVAIP